MSLSKIWVGVAVGAVGLLSLLWTRSKDPAQSSSATPRYKSAAGPGGSINQPGWTRSRRLADQLNYPHGVVVQGDYAYVVTGGFAEANNAVLKIATTTGVVQTLVQVPQVVTGELVIDDKYVYFSSESGNAILRVSQEGGEAVAVVRAFRPSHLAIDDTHIYYASFVKQSPGGSVQRVAKAGGDAEILLTGQFGVDQIVVDDHNVYFRSNSGIWRVGKSGGAAQCLLPATLDLNVHRLVGDSSHLYYFSKIASSGKYRLSRLAKTGGPPEVIAPSADSSGRLALTDTHVYFFRQVSLYDNALAKVLKGGGTPELVDGSGYDTGYLAVFGDNVYFTDVNSLFQVPK